jgi:hypothetical protein
LPGDSEQAVKPPPFSDEEIERYSRQILLREVGGRGQRRLLAAAPSLFCADALGELAACYLRRAGVAQLAVFAEDAQVAARAERLRDEGPPSERPRCEPLRSAPERLRALVEQAPGFTLVLLQPQPPGGAAPERDDELLFARCTADRGVVGSGLDALLAECRETRDELPAGDAAALTGSALALLVTQRLLGLPTPQRLRFDTGRPAAPWRIEPAAGA